MLGCTPPLGSARARSNPDRAVTFTSSRAPRAAALAPAGAFIQGMSRSSPGSSPHRTAALVVLALLAAVVLGACAWAARRACAGKRTGGVALILLVVLLWTSSNVVIQLVFEEAHFRKPFFLTWYGAALLVVYLPFYPRRLCRLGAALADECGLGSGRSRGRYHVVAAPGRAASAEEVLAEEGLAPGAALGIALRLGLTFFAYQLFFNVALELTAVSTVTVLSASSGLWTLLFSAVRLSCPRPVW